MSQPNTEGPSFFLKAGVLHQGRTIPFAKTITPVTVPTWGYHSKTLLTIPKIPLELFVQIISWQRKIAKEHKCESTTSLFLIDGKWVAVPFYQENNQSSMTADVSWEPEKGFMGKENHDLLSQYADLSPVHATLHNHVFSGAGQSGRDSADEKDKPGPHITIGNLDSDKITFHARLSTLVGKEHVFLPLRLTDIIEIPFPMGAIQETTLDDLEKAWLTLPTDGTEYPKEWDDRFHLKKSYAYQRPDAINPMVPGGSGAGSGENHNLEQFITANREQLGTWPYDFLRHLDLSSPKAFAKGLDTAAVIVIHAAHAVAETEFPDDDMGYVKLFDHLREKFNWKDPAQTANAS